MCPEFRVRINLPARCFNLRFWLFPSCLAGMTGARRHSGAALRGFSESDRKGASDTVHNFNSFVNRYDALYTAQGNLGAD